MMNEHKTSSERGGGLQTGSASVSAGFTAEDLSLLVHTGNRRHRQTEPANEEKQQKKEETKQPQNAKAGDVRRSGGGVSSKLTARNEQLKTREDRKIQSQLESRFSATEGHSSE